MGNPLGFRNTMARQRWSYHSYSLSRLHTSTTNLNQLKNSLFSTRNKRRCWQRNKGCRRTGSSKQHMSFHLRTYTHSHSLLCCGLCTSWRTSCQHKESHRTDRS
jgi:hypothetical protein